MNKFDINQVAIYKTLENDYPVLAPFNPPVVYPEYPFHHEIQKENFVYDAVRGILNTLGLDKENFGNPEWNPLGDIISPGDSVVIKPNFVRDPRTPDVDITSVITHGSVIRPIIDYVHIALKGRGEIIVADAPQFDANFEVIKKLSGIENVIEYLNNKCHVPVKLYDLRLERVDYEDGIIVLRHKLKGDPRGYTVVDLGKESQFYEIRHLCDKIRGSDYDKSVTQQHHNEDKNEYCISNTILNADVIISLPKMKTHKKAGVTLNLKNMVGINGNKNYLPHYRTGPPSTNGDEFPISGLAKQTESKMYELAFWLIPRMNQTGLNLIRYLRKIDMKINRKSKENQRAGDWSGNDTIWRMVLDLNKILLFANKSGEFDNNNEQQRKYFSIIDGIVAGEGEGPMTPTKKKCGLLISGFNPGIVDMVTAKIMGFDYTIIPCIAEYLKEYNLAPEKNKIISNESDLLDDKSIEKYIFKRSSGWTMNTGD